MDKTKRAQLRTPTLTPALPRVESIVSLTGFIFSFSMFMFNQITTSNLRRVHLESVHSFMFELQLSNLDEELGSSIRDAPVVTYTFKSPNKNR